MPLSLIPKRRSAATTSRDNPLFATCARPRLRSAALKTRGKRAALSARQAEVELRAGGDQLCGGPCEPRPGVQLADASGLILGLRRARGAVGGDDKRDQTRPHPPLPRTRARCPHNRRAAHRPRQGHRPLIAGIRTPRQGRPPKNWTTIDHDYETLRREMKTLLNDLGIATNANVLSTTSCR